MVIKNIIGSMGGILCDGAKLGCALKLSTAAGIAIKSAWLALSGASIPSGDGLVCSTADKTIQMIRKLASIGMIDTDEEMCKLVIGRENESKHQHSLK